jgi:16S rRNA (guanine527-N7)-methyltransferase
MEDKNFEAKLKTEWPELSPEIVHRVSAFRELVVSENKIQNLTRLTSPSDFVFGHVMDVKALLDTGWMSYPAIDIGSGCGVPGMLSALVRPEKWILCESEKRKSEFLEKAIESLGMGEFVSVFSGRAEAYLLRHSEAKTLVTRATGSIEKVIKTLSKCSTWNKVIFFKGPRFEQEIDEFFSKTTKNRKNFRVDQTFLYSVGPEEKKRALVSIVRTQ